MNSADVLAISSIRPLDCFRILCELNRHGISNAEIANILGLEESTVRHWKRGSKRPRDPFARRLVLLFLRHYPDADIPQMSDNNHAVGELSAI